MATDFLITISGTDGSMSFDPTDTIMNNVYLSLMTERGSFFQDLNFGSRLHLLKRKKNTEQTASLARSYCEEALAWLIQTGRATRINVTSEIEKSINPYRLKLRVEVTEASGRRVTFEIFKDVA